MSGSSPPVRRWDAVTRTIDRPRLGPITVPMAVAVFVLTGGAWLTVALATGRPPILSVIIAIAGTVATGLLASAVNAFARPPAARRAFEAFAYLGEWELDRVARLADVRMAPSVPAMRKLIESTPEGPDDRWLRVDLLIASGDLDTARAIAERMPVDTPYQRLEQVSAMTVLDWLQGGSGDPAPLREAAAAVGPLDSPVGRNAEIVVALAEVRYRVGRGDADPLQPLRRARERIGSHADDVLLRMTRRPAGSFVRTAAALVVLFLVIHWTGIG